MKASLLLPLIAVLSVALTGSALGEYPFDPLIASGSGQAVSAPHYPDAVGTDPFLYQDPYPPVDDLFAAESPILPGWISATFNPGTERVIYNGEIFQPLYQDGRTIWYVDFRGQGDDFSASEFNLGTGVRSLSDAGWVFGFYTFWDHLRSSHGNHFNQGTIGVEAMSVFWDARFNVYFPESKAKAAGTPTAGVSNGNVVVRSGVERAYWGLDMEVGNLLWAAGPGAQHEVRGFLALYHFDHSANSLHSITGPRGRVEWRWFDLPYFGPGSRFTLGVTAQHDRVRNGQLFAFAQMRIPLDVWAHKRRRLSPLHRRMLDPITRDVDIVSNMSHRSEAAVNPHTGREFRRVHQIDGETEYIGDLLRDSEEDDVFLFNGGAGDVIFRHSFELKPGQTVLGGGSSLMVRGAHSGRRAAWNLDGSRPTVEFNGNAAIVWHEPPSGQGVAFDTMMHSDPTGFQMADRTSLSGVGIIGGHGSVSVHDASHVQVDDVSIREFQGVGIDVTGSSDVSVTNVTVEDAQPVAGFSLSAQTDSIPSYLADLPPDPDDQPNLTGVFVHDSNNLHMEHVAVRDVTEGIRVVKSGDITIERSSVENATRDGVRLIETTDVTLAELEIEDVADHRWLSYLTEEVGYGQRELAGIHLDSTERTTIRDSRFRGTQGFGISGTDAVSTKVGGVEMTAVYNGVTFTGGNDVEVADVEISLRSMVQDSLTLWENGQPPFATAACVCPPPQNGVSLSNVMGDVKVRDSFIHDGIDGGIHPGWGIEIHSWQEGASNVQVMRNLVDRTAERGLLVRSRSGHHLTAHVEGNELRGGASVGLHDSSGAENKIVFTQNSVAGNLSASSSTGSRLDLSVVDNVFNGDQMGRIEAAANERLWLTYNGNTSQADGEVMRLVNKNGLFSTGQLMNNDHEPVTEGGIITAIEDN